MKKLAMIIIILSGIPLNSNAISPLRGMVDTLLSPLIKDRNVPWALQRKEKIHKKPSRPAKTYVPPATSLKSKKKKHIYTNAPSPKKREDNVYRVPSANQPPKKPETRIKQANNKQPKPESAKPDIKVYREKPALWYGGSWSSRTKRPTS
jgi:hypothetical protein